MSNFCNCRIGNSTRRLVVVNGPRGATGPSGSNVLSTNNAYLSTYGPVSVNPLSGIPLTSNNVVNGSNITHIAGLADISLNPGLYSINYVATANIPIGQNSVSLAFYVNGSMLPETSVVVNGNAGENMLMSGTNLINITASSIINLVNLTAVNTDYRRVMMNIIKLQ